MIFKSITRFHIFKKRSFIGLFLYPILLVGAGYNPTIAKVEILGNSKTLDYVLEREIQHESGIPLDSALANLDRNRLENLGIFSEVEWNAIPLENGSAILRYKVQESIQKSPPGVFPIYEEGTGWSVTGGWIIKNFRGRNQTLLLGGSVGGKDTYGINFLDPWMFGNHVSLSIESGRTFYNHLFLNRVVEVSSFQIGIGKWFGDHIKTSTGFELEAKSFESNSFFYFAPDLSISIDTRDIYWNPSKGILFSQSVYWMNGIDPTDFSLGIWSHSYSIYQQLNQSPKKLILAFNMSSKLKFGDKDTVWLNYFGDSYTVRGWPLPSSDTYNNESKNFRFGHEFIHGSIELRKDIIPKYATKFGTEFGLSLLVFMDSGIIANDWKDLKQMSPMSGAGVGMRIPLPMVDVLRFDYGWGYRDGVWNSGAYHWGVAQKF